ncbi:MAG: glutamyl-tRNA reductase [Halanaerobiaceae bacterium]
MQTGLLTINHQHTPVDIREKVKFSPGKYELGYQKLKENSHLKEAVILSTCNRTEIYFCVQENLLEVITEIKKILLDIFSLQSSILNDYCRIEENIAVVQHLFAVTAGLKSQVPGEQQILGQVKRAQKRAQKNDLAGKYLNYFFRQAITTAKKIRTETGFSDKKVSISSAAVDILENEFSGLEGKKVLLVGAGKMSRIALEILREKGVADIYAVNRTYSKLDKFKERFPELEIFDFARRYQLLEEVDIVISSTAAENYIFKAKKFEDSCSDWGERLFIDLGLPRDVEPEIGDFCGCKVYNLDSLEQLTKKNRLYRLQEAKKAKKIIREQICSVQEWLQWQEVVPLIKMIKQENFRIVEDELDNIEASVLQTEEQEQCLEDFAHHLSKKLFNRIILNLKDLAQNECSRENFVELAKRILTSTKGDKNHE